MNGPQKTCPSPGVLSRAEQVIRLDSPRSNDDNPALPVELTTPDVVQDRRIVLQKEMLHIVRTFCPSSFRTEVTPT
jgi:hypothetical protein